MSNVIGNYKDAAVAPGNAFCDYCLLILGCFSRATAIGIRVYQYNSKNHIVSYAGTYGGYNSMSCIVIDGNLLIACVEGAKADLLVSFRIQENGVLEELSRLHTESFSISHLSIDRTNHFVFAASMGSASVGMVKYDNSGKLEMSDRYIFNDPGSFELGNSKEKRQSASRIHFSEIMPDGKHLSVCNMGSDKIYIMKIDTTSGRLGLAPEFTITTEGGEAPRHIVYSRCGKFAYMNSEIGNKIYTFAINGDSSLTQLQVLSTLDPSRDNPDNGYSSVAIVSQDGKYLFVANRGQNNIAGFRVGEDGLLSSIGFFDCYGKSPRGISFGVDDEVLFSSNDVSGSLTVIEFDALSGRLGKCLQTLNGIPGAANIALKKCLR